MHTSVNMHVEEWQPFIVDGSDSGWRFLLSKLDGLQEADTVLGWADFIVRIWKRPLFCSDRLRLWSTDSRLLWRQTPFIIYATSCIARQNTR